MNNPWSMLLGSALTGSGSDEGNRRRARLPMITGTHYGVNVAGDVYPVKMTHSVAPLWNLRAKFKAAAARSADRSASM